MKSIGQIMDEMGFNSDSNPSSKAAFIKYLAKQAYNVDLEIPEIYQTEEESGEMTLDSFLNKESPEDKKSNVKDLTNYKKNFKSKKEEPKQLEMNFEDYKIAE